MTDPITYADAGVDIEKANTLVSAISRITKQTNRPGVMSEIGGFAGLFSIARHTAEMQHPVLVSSTDGVGTKLKIAFMLDKHDTIGIDLVAMCVNDILVQGAKPLFMLDYLAVGKLDNARAEAIITGVAEGCKQAKCALIGGETAEMPGFYPPGEYDLAGFVVGIVDNSKIIDGTSIRVGFVSTNSICQGEQVGVLWSALFARGISIAFAWRTFCWQSEARGKAHVHVIIVGFGRNVQGPRKLFEVSGDTLAVSEVRNISPYLVEGSNAVVLNRSKPLCDVPEICFGNQPIDGGHLILNAEERDALLAETPEIEPFVRLFLGSEEFINGGRRWCLWLKDADFKLIRSSAIIAARISAVRDFRLASTRKETQRLAETPTQFAFVSHTDRPYLLIPSVSSEKRKYIPIDFMSADVIASNLVMMVPDADLWHFGVLTSAMHNAWMRQVCGRLKSDYRYSNKLVYNNFPWPPFDAVFEPADDAGGIVVCEAAARSYWTSYHEPGDDGTPPKPPRLMGDARKIAVVKDAAQAVLDARSSHRGATLADLYDPLFMPPDLVKAHAALDRAVDRCYRSAPFANDRQRVEFLFELYERLATPLLKTGKTIGRKR